MLETLIDPRSLNCIYKLNIYWNLIKLHRPVTYKVFFKCQSKKIFFPVRKYKTGGKMLKNCYFSKLCPFLHVLWCLQSMNSLSSRLHENIQSLIKKLTFFYIGMLCRSKMGEIPQKSLFFVEKENCFFSW